MAPPSDALPIDWRSVAPWFVVVMGASLVLLGLALPWRTQPAFDVETLGIDMTGGKVVFGAAIALGAATYGDRGANNVVSFAMMAIAAVATMALSILELAETAGFGPGIEIGPGLWVGLAGSAIAMVGVIWRAVTR